MTLTEDDLLGQLDDGEGEPSAEQTQPTPDLHASHASLRFTTKKFALQSMLDKAGSVVPNKNTYPVLKNFYLEVQPDLLRVMATDLELSVLARTSLVQVEEGHGGVAVFPAKKMQEILKSAEDDEFVVDVTDGVATLRVGRASWTLRLQSGDEYPDLPELEEVTIVELDREKFLRAIESVRYAAPSREVRATLAMINVAYDPSSEAGKMTACDGVRFQQTQLDGWPQEVDGEPFEIQIPIGAVEDLTKLLNTNKLPTVGVGTTENHLIFRLANDYFIASKLVADFPDVGETLLRPALQNQDELTCDRAELLQAVKRVRINADPETSAIALEVSPGKIRVMSQDKYGNRAVEELDAGWTKVARTLVVNHQYLSEMLTMTKVASLRLFLGEDSRSRKCFLVHRDEETNSLGVINQMRGDWTGQDG